MKKVLFAIQYMVSEPSGLTFSQPKFFRVKNRREAIIAAQMYAETALVKVRVTFPDDTHEAVGNLSGVYFGPKSINSDTNIIDL